MAITFQIKDEPKPLPYSSLAEGNIGSLFKVISGGEVKIALVGKKEIIFFGQGCTTYIPKDYYNNSVTVLRAIENAEIVEK